MAYQLYHYSAGRKFEYADRFEAVDDQTALIKALAKASSDEMELWCGHRRVWVFALAEAESAS
jgi:hypothetical protein